MWHFKFVSSKNRIVGLKFDEIAAILHQITAVNIQNIHFQLVFNVTMWHWENLFCPFLASCKICESFSKQTNIGNNFWHILKGKPKYANIHFQQPTAFKSIVIKPFQKHIVTTFHKKFQLWWRKVANMCLKLREAGE